MTENVHEPVMSKEVLEFLQPEPNQNFVDCTLGGGGHANSILEKTAPKGKLLGIDLDPLAINLTKKATDKFSKRVILIKENFKNLKQIIDENKFKKISGILLDLGLSSNQLQDTGRGFSFSGQGALDMRFGGQSNLTAAEFIKHASVEDMTDLFKSYSDERLSKPIAQAIAARREEQEINTAEELAEVIMEVYQKFFRGRSKSHPATKIFQALRIAVNDEVQNLQLVLPQALEVLEPGGRIVVLSFHSLEDRIVKRFFQEQARLKDPTLKLLNKKPLVPTREEIKSNPRSRSTKLRAIEKI